MTALQSFETTVQQGETRIENAASTATDIRGALRESCGVVEGYYLAGAASLVEYMAASSHLRSVANQRLAILDLQKQARAEGIT